MNEKVYTELDYVRPDLEATRENSEQLANSIENASSVEDVIRYIDEWNKSRLAVSTMQSLAEVRYTQNVADPKAKAEKEFFDQNAPSIVESQLTVSQSIVACPFRKELEDKLGELFFRRLEDSLRVFSPNIKDLLIQESALQNEYNELTATARIEFDGQVYNLSTISKVGESLDRDVRERVSKKLYGFLGENSVALDRIYDELVHLRHEKALALGYSNYIEMRYTELGRVDYNADNVRNFRKQVVDVVVPIVAQLRAAQKKRLGYDVLNLWDERLHFPDGNPVAQGKHDYIVKAAESMYKDLSDETPEFFQVMLNRQLMDLESRDNKATGGYCTSFPLYQVPFIFANFNQTSHDVEVLTHEAGHAFQAWRSRNYTIPEYQWPTAEACEIHSMSMEYLTWPWMESFFGEMTEKFKFFHLSSSIIFLPYGCMVDAFQHWVYENPYASPADRLATWHNLEKTYMPWRTGSGVPEAEQGRHWQFQRHIYESPFYYIDYTLASTCAMQYLRWYQDNPREALTSYLKVCDIGGSKPFLGIVEDGGLRSPFSPGTLEEVVGDCFSWLNRVYPSYF